MELLLIRHGEDSYSSNCDDRSLSEIGIRRAKALGKVIASKEVDIIFTSPLKRAIETAEIISNETDIEYIVKDELVERKYECEDNITMINSKVETNDESYDAMMLRATRLLVSIKDYDDKRVVIISHNEILNVFINELLQISSNIYPVFNLEPCSITKLNVSNYRATNVDYINNLKYRQYFMASDNENTYNMRT